MAFVKRRPAAAVAALDTETEALGSGGTAVVLAARPLLVAGRLLGLTPLRCSTSPPRCDVSVAWALYSWGLITLLAVAMGIALYSSAPTGRVQQNVQNQNRGSPLFRADIFVFTVTCLNDSVAVTLLVLANVKARGVSVALNQLLQCAAGALTPLTGRGLARWAALQVGATALCLVAYLLGVTMLFCLTEQDDSSSSNATDEPPLILGLAHLPSLPLQLFFCLFFGNQIGLLWLLVRALNRRLESMARGRARAQPLHLSHNAPAPTGWVREPFTLAVGFPAATASLAAARWASPGRHTHQHHVHEEPKPTPRAPLHGEVREVHALHAEVRHALTLLTSAHGLELLLMVLITFSAATTSLYVWLTSRDETALLALAWSGLVALFLFGVLTAGELVKRESRCTMEQTQRLLIYHEMSPDLRCEMRRFSHQLLHQGLQVSAYGFLSLDYTLLQGLIGSVTTYLIMVIQLSPEDTTAAGRGNATGSA